MISSSRPVTALASGFVPATTPTAATNASVSANQGALKTAEQALVAEVLDGQPAPSQLDDDRADGLSIVADETTTGAQDQAVSATLIGADTASLDADGQAAADQARDALLDPAGGSPSLLGELVGQNYSASNPPDYLQVSTGPGITAGYAGGFTTVGWNLNGANVSFFTTGQQPEITKGFSISFDPSATAQQRQSAISMAQTYLAGHLSDARNAAGGWNQPTFDVTCD